MCGGWLRPHAPQAGLDLHTAHPVAAFQVLTGRRCTQRQVVGGVGDERVERRQTGCEDRDVGVL